MAGEVVGTAFVRIKALTRGLGKEIEKSVKKGMKDAKLDKAGEEEGKKMGKSLGDSTVDSASETIKKRSGDIVPDDVFDDVKKKFADKMSFDDVDIFPENTGEKFREDIEKNTEAARESIKRFGGTVKDDFDIFDGFGDNFRREIEEGTDSSRSALRRFKKGYQEAFDIDPPEVFEELHASARRESGGINNILDKLSAKMKNLGGGSGGGLPGGFFGKSIAGIGTAIVAALPYIQDAGSAVLAYATGLVAQVGFLTTALVGFGAAAGAAIGSALLPILPIMLAFKAPSEQLTVFQDSMKALYEEVQRIGVATQVTLLPALDEALFVLGDSILMLSEYGLYVGHIVGNFALFTSAVLTGEMAQNRFADILESSLRILDMLLPTLLNVGDILSGLWVASIPASERFVGTLSNMVERWRDIVNFGLYTGTLTETLDLWYTRAELVGSALGDLAGAIFDILSAGADSADSVFVRFDDWARRYRDWTESEVGQNKLKLIFDNSLAVMREINGVVAELFDGIFGRLDEAGGVDSMVKALQNFRDVLPEIKEDLQGFLDTIEGVNKIVGPAILNKIQQAFEELREPVGRLVYAILDVMRAMEESGAFETFLDLLEILAEVLTTVLSIPGFGTFVGYMIAFGGAAKIAGIALGPLVRVLGPFVAIIKGIAAARAGYVLVQTADGLVRMSKAAAAAKGISGAGTALSNVAAAAGGTATGGLAGTLGKIGTGLRFLGPWGIAASVGVAAVGGAMWYFSNRDAKRFQQEVRQVNDALGTLNGALDITRQGLVKYLEVDSRFATERQKDDLEQMGLSFESLSRQISRGSTSIREFTDLAIKSGQVDVEIGKTLSSGIAVDTERVSRSLQELQREYKLTNEQVRALQEGESVNANGVQLQLKGNISLLKSLQETYAATAQAARDSMDDFRDNPQVNRLLGEREVNRIRNAVLDPDDEKSVNATIEGMNRLAAAAKLDSREVKNLTQATYDHVNAQVAHLSGTEKILVKNALLRAENGKMFREIRANLRIIASEDFQKSPAYASMAFFSDMVKNVDLSKFKELAHNGDLDKLNRDFPGLTDATSNLFDNLKNMPTKEFNAAAQALNIDAESLRAAMAAADQAIVDLQETAVSTLPSIAEMLDKATSVNEEDGGSIFDERGFEKGVMERIQTTEDFNRNIIRLADAGHHEAARLAAEQGPEAAKNLADMMTGPKGSAINDALTRMNQAEEDLKWTIAVKVGPNIRAQFLAEAKPMAEGWGFGMAAGLNSPATLEALRNSSMGTLNYLARGFKGYFVLDMFGLRFVHTGTFVRNTPTNNPKNRGGGAGGLSGGVFSRGGFVGGSVFDSFGPRGTDTVPAWLTPGEFVLRRSIAQAIPPSVLNALNAGDTRLMSLLNSVGQNRPGSPNATNSVVAVPTNTTRNGVVIENMTVVAPSPLDAARQTVDRLRIMQAQQAGI